MTEVTTKQVNLPANIMESAWGAEGASSTDMIIPRLMLMQPLSQFVASGKASPGDIVESVNGTVMAKKGAALEIIPFYTYKEWARYRFIDQKWEFLEKVPYGPQNAHWKYEATENNIAHRNDSIISFFAVAASDIHSLPYLISFKRSSYYAGKKLSTHFQVSSMKKMPPATQVFKLSSALQTVDKNSFWTLDVTPSRESTKEELAISYEWYQTVKHSAVKVDEAKEDGVPF